MVAAKRSRLVPLWWRLCFLSVRVDWMVMPHLLFSMNRLSHFCTVMIRIEESQSRCTRSEMPWMLCCQLVRYFYFICYCYFLFMPLPLLTHHAIILSSTYEHLPSIHSVDCSQSFPGGTFRSICRIDIPVIIFQGQMMHQHPLLDWIPNHMRPWEQKMF